MLRGLCSGRGFGDALGAPDRGGTLEDTGEEEQPLTLTSGVSAGPHSEIPSNYLHFNLAFGLLYWIKHVMSFLLATQNLTHHHRHRHKVPLRFYKCRVHTYVHITPRAEQSLINWGIAIKSITYSHPTYTSRSDLDEVCVCVCVSPRYNNLWVSERTQIMDEGEIGCCDSLNINAVEVQSISTLTQCERKLLPPSVR